MRSAIFNVKEYGAVGNGKGKDTEAIQQAIDACAEAGGGTVFLPAGRYLSGTIYLKSNINLHLSGGATLVGSTDREDYNADDVFPENYASARDQATGAHLIIAYRQRNVSMTGAGTIDGNSAGFFEPLPPFMEATYRHKDGNFPIRSWRTGAMVFFCRCERVSVRDIALNNSPYWTLLSLGCDNVQMSGLTIDNPPATRNGDGIGIDCSRRVTVSDCIIRSGDDCITLRGNERPLGEHAQPCEDVTITNCVLSTPCNAIRVGVGLGDIRRCTLSHIVVRESRTAINIVSSYTEDSHGTCIEHIDFSDFTIDATNPIVVSAGPGATPPGAIRDIRFSRFQVTASAGSQWVGKPGMPLQRIHMSDFEWHVHGGTMNDDFVSEMPAELSHHGYPGVKDRPSLPAALYGTYLEEVTFQNIRIHWHQPSPAWRDGIHLEKCGNAVFHNVGLRQPREGGGAAILCRESDGLLVKGCYAATGTHTFLKVEESLPDSRIRCLHNDFTGARQPLDVDSQIFEVGNLYS